MEKQLESFQKHVSNLFSDLNSDDDILSLSWIGKLLEAFLISQEEFRVIFLTNKPTLFKPPMDRIISDFFERSVKALDLCNAIRDGIDQIRQWIKHLDIVINVFKSRNIAEGQIRRARKALTDLAILMIDEKDSSSGNSILSHRNRSFGRNTPKDSKKAQHFRSLSWSVSRNWSACKQIQSIGVNLNAPRGNEISQTNGLVIPVYTMNSVLLFVMWVLVASIPCQDRGISQVHLSVPRSFCWASAVLGMHEKVLEESKKKERKGSSGLMKEIYMVEKCTRNLSEAIESVSLPIGEEKEKEVRMVVDELDGVCEVLKEGLDLLEKQVKEVFYRIVRSRTEGLDCIGKSHNGE